MDDSTRPTLSRLEPSLPSRSHFDPEQFLFQSMVAFLCRLLEFRANHGCPLD